ncbi:hypothetical protein L3X38_003776 [Prunus dulcis]|uniref:Uncharacterized protein n=1 Tax=Prunus dulcis TaxID=3755 RepID=A0AAD5F2L2_PRUDU|nr:hypothetical protein L3X38_003776 [Prunus dulcis]
MKRESLARVWRPGLEELATGNVRVLAAEMLEDLGYLAAGTAREELGKSQLKFRIAVAAGFFGQESLGFLAKMRLKFI